MSSRKKTVLIVDDDADYRYELEQALGRDFTVLAAATAAEAWHRALEKDVDIVLLDIRLQETDAANREGLQLLRKLTQDRPGLPVVMMTAYPDIDLAVEALRGGAKDFIQKDRLEIREFRKAVANALRLARLERENAELKEELRRAEPWELVGDDQKIHRVREMIDVVAQDGYCTVLIRGETGTGKELVARAIHSRGWRKDEPFKTVPLPAFNAMLVESELFGHAKGAFTGAVETRIGHLEAAAGGVVLLDEIGEISLELQAKLLRLVECQRFARVGSTGEVELRAQILCATNRNLEAAVEQGQFRQDLYYRLKVFEILLPPLRERTGDIPLMADHFLSQFRQAARTGVAGVHPDALACLAAYSFPGNVRELHNVIAMAMMLATHHHHPLIEVEDLPITARQPEQAGFRVPSVRLPPGGVNLDEELGRIELSFIEEALRRTGGRKTNAWPLLRLNDRFALRRRARRLIEIYPDLLENFPLVQAHYMGDDSGANGEGEI